MRLRIWLIALPLGLVLAMGTLFSACNDGDAPPNLTDGGVASGDLAHKD